MTNTFSTGDPEQALRRLLAKVFGAMITSGGLPTFPASSLTTHTFSTDGFVLNGGGDELVYTNQLAAAVGPFNQGDGTYWLALHRDIHTDLSPWIRQVSTRYAWQRTESGALTSPPTPVDNCFTFAACKVSGGAITEAIAIATPLTGVNGLRYTPPLPQDDTRQAVTFEGGEGLIAWRGIQNGAVPAGEPLRASIGPNGDEFVVHAVGGGGQGRAGGQLRLEAQTTLRLSRNGTTYLFLSSLDGGIITLNLPTTAPATSGAIWVDPSDSNRLKQVP